MRKMHKVRFFFRKAVFRCLYIEYGKFRLVSDVDGGRVMKFWILFLASVCSVLSWADCHTLDLSVLFSKDFMVIGVKGGFTPNIFYTTQSGQYGTRYVTLHRESEDDPGRIMWALYSEKNGTLDHVIVDEDGQMYKAVGSGEGGKNPPSRKSFKYRGKDGVVAPLSALDEVAWNLIQFHKTAMYRSDSNDVLLVVEAEKNREDFLRKIRSYSPVVQAAKRAGFTYFSFAVSGAVDSSFGDLTKLSQDMFDAVGLEMPPQEEVKKHRRCSCVVESKNKTPRVVKFENDNRDGVGEPVELNTPHNRGVLKILKGK